MNIVCPGCHQELKPNESKTKPTKDRKAVKVRCCLCHHAWKIPVPEEVPVVTSGE